MISEPLVSVVTPVYNCAEYLSECIESVLGQTYGNWDYTIIDNCSTDGSLEIVRRYAAKCPRIKIVQNTQFLRAIVNHNVAFRQLSPFAKYCKMVFADDWIFPECISKMVGVAEQYPTVGIVGAYGLQGKDVAWRGLAYPSTFVAGRELCRRLFLDNLYVFGTATSLLFRSDLVRNRDPFYIENSVHADMEACVALLKSWDFGFVHQVLTFTRVREESVSTLTNDLNTFVAGRLSDLVNHGADCLSDAELKACLDRLMSEYYNFLAVSLIRGRRSEKLWSYHKNKLSEIGVGLSRTRLAGAVIARIFKAILNPAETSRKLRRLKMRRALLTPQTDEDSVRSRLQANGNNGQIPTVTADR